MKFGKVNVSFGFLLALSVFYFWDYQNLLPLMMLSVSLHELGHYLAVKLLGGRIKSLNLHISGICMEIAPRPMFSYQKELAATLAGPLASVLCALAGAFVGAVFGLSGAYVFAGINIVTAIFNLLPAGQLDGGRAIFLLLSYFFGVDAAERTLVVVSCATALVLLLMGYGTFLFSGYNFTLMFAAAYILISVAKRKGIVKERIRV